MSILNNFFKKTKKITALVCTFAIITTNCFGFGGLVSGSVIAADETSSKAELHIQLDKKDYEAGETVAVNLYMFDTDFYSLTLALGYDDSKLGLSGSKVKDIIDADFYSYDDEEEVGQGVWINKSKNRLYISTDEDKLSEKNAYVCYTFEAHSDADDEDCKKYMSANPEGVKIASFKFIAQKDVSLDEDDFSLVQHPGLTENRNYLCKYLTSDNKLVTYTNCEYKIEINGGAKDVIEAIQKIGTITPQSKPLIEEARRQYDLLSDSDRQSIPADLYDLLLAAELKIEPIIEINTYVNTGDYEDPELTEVQGAITYATNRINGVSTIEEIQSLLLEAKERIDKQQTKAQKKYAAEIEEVKIRIDGVTESFTLNESSINQICFIYNSCISYVLPEEYANKLAYKCNLYAKKYVDYLESISNVGISSGKSITYARSLYNISSMNVIISNYDISCGLSADATSKRLAEIEAKYQQLVKIDYEDSLIQLGDYTVNIGSRYNGEKVLRIRDYTGSLTILTLPDEINGMAVVDLDLISDNHFNNITELTIPSSVKTITYCSHLSNLTKLNLSEGLLEMKTDALNYLDGLTSITLPSTLEAIDGGAIAHCNNIKSIYVKANNIVSKQNSPAFWFLPSLESLIYEEGSSIGLGVNYCDSLSKLVLPEGMIYSGKMSNLASLEEIILPSSLVYIQSISGTAIKQINIPQNVVSIECLEDNKKLESLTIPDKVTSIADGLLRNCTALKTCIMPDNITKLSSTFEGCSSLRYVKLPANCQTLYRVFVNCSSMETVAIPESVLSISYLFSGCSSLSSIVLPDSLTFIGHDTFNDCSSLKEVDIPYGVTKLGSSTFKNCSSLEKVNYSVNVTDIGEYCFSGCSSLKEILIPNGTTSIGKMMFAYCTALENVSIPDSVTSIGWMAFKGCNKLKSIKLSKNTSLIDREAFMNCSSLESIVLPDRLTNIGQSAFRYCSSLKSVKFSESLAYIGTSAFEGCSSLDNVIIPETVSEICSGAFSGCTSLKNIKLPSYLPYATMFSNNSSLESVTLPSGIKKFGGIYKCSSITSIELPYGTTWINWGAFDGCNSLKMITLPSTISLDNTIKDYKTANLKQMFSYSGYTLYYELDNRLVVIRHPYGSELATNPDINYHFIETNEAQTSSPAADFTWKANLVDGVEDGTATITGYKGAGGEDTLVVIPSEINGYTVTAIADSAFSFSKVFKVFIPSTIISIGDGAFYNCWKETKTSAAHVEPIKVYYSQGFDILQFSNAFNRLALMEYEEVIPESQDRDFEIMPNYGKNTGLEDGTAYIKNYIGPGGNVTIPKYINGYKIVAIADNAFANNNTILSVKIPSTVTAIGKNAFADCKSMSSLSFENGSSNLIICDSAFSNCSALTEVTLPISAGYVLVEASGNQASKMELLESRIDRNAFNGCSQLAKISIPDTIDYIGSNAFSGCSENLLIECLPGTAAADYAATYNIKALLYANNIYLINRRYQDISNMTIAVGESILAAVTLRPIGANDTYTVSSDGDSIFTIEKSGDEYLISGQAEGTGTITISTSHGEVFEAKVTVVKNSPEIVTNRINNLKTVTLRHQLQVESARRLYDSLSFFEKLQVTVLDKLIKAEERLQALKNADVVAQSIAGISEILGMTEEEFSRITQEDIDKIINSPKASEFINYINDIIIAYDKLTHEEKAAVSYYGNLLNIKDFIANSLHDSSVIKTKYMDWNVKSQTIIMDTADNDVNAYLKEKLPAGYTVLSLNKMVYQNMLTSSNGEYNPVGRLIQGSLSTEGIDDSLYGNIYVLTQDADGNFILVEPQFYVGYVRFETINLQIFGLVGSVGTIDVDPNPSPSEPVEEEPKTPLGENPQKTAAATSLNDGEVLADEFENAGANKESIDEKIEIDQNNEANRNAGHVLGLTISKKMSAVNLLLLVLTFIIGLFAFYQKKSLDETDDSKTVNNRKTRVALSALVFIIALVLFLITQPKIISFGLVDKYTIAMGILFIGQILITVFSKKIRIGIIEGDKKNHEKTV